MMIFLILVGEKTKVVILLIQNFNVVIKNLMNIIVKKEIAMDAIFKELVGVIVTNKIHLCLIVIFKKPNIVVNKKMISLNKKKFCLDGA
jgi:hypothetical protein